MSLTELKAALLKKLNEDEYAPKWLNEWEWA